MITLTCMTSINLKYIIVVHHRHNFISTLKIEKHRLIVIKVVFDAHDFYIHTQILLFTLKNRESFFHCTFFFLIISCQLDATYSYL